MRRPNRRLSADEREVLAAQHADLEATRREGAAWSAAFGEEGPPASFDRDEWRQPAFLAALEHYAADVSATPSQYRGWLLGYLRDRVIELLSEDGVAAALAAGTDFVKAVGVKRLPQLWWCGGNRANFLSSIVGAIDEAFTCRHSRARYEVEAQYALEELRLTWEQQFWFLTDALKGSNSAVRRLSIKWLLGRWLGKTRDPFNALTAERAAGVLAGLLDDVDELIRWWAALQLAVLAPHTPGLGPRFWQAVAAEPFDLGCYDDRNYDFRVGQREVFKNYLLPQEWPEAGPSAVPGLATILADHLGAKTHTRRAAAEALARIGWVSVGALCALQARLDDPSEEEDVRRAAQQALDVLTEKLHGRENLGLSTPDEGLLLTIWENPDDAGLRLIYADWLDEHGFPERAAYVRFQHELDHVPEEDPRFYTLHRMQDTIHSGWLEIWRRLMARRQNGHTTSWQLRSWLETWQRQMARGPSAARD